MRGRYTTYYSIDDEVLMMIKLLRNPDRVRAANEEELVSWVPAVWSDSMIRDMFVSGS